MSDTTITAQPGTPFIDVIREFDAPPARVFRAWTEPELVAQWLGPHGMKMEILEYDARPGGSYRYIHRNEQGEFRFRGVFHTVALRPSIQPVWLFGRPGSRTRSQCPRRRTTGTETRWCESGVWSGST